MNKRDRKFIAIRLLTIQEETELLLDWLRPRED